jgi:hypothetical protein
VKASIVRNGAEPGIEGMVDASPAVFHELLINARAAGEPDALLRAVARQMACLPGEIDVRSIACFRPAPPD